MLAEWEEPKYMMLDSTCLTAGKFHHMLNKIAKGKANADSIVTYLKRDAKNYDSTAFRMHFTSIMMK